MPIVDAAVIILAAWHPHRVAREQLEPATPCFWVCDYVIRQGGVDQTVPALFTHVIRDIGRTLVFADPWDDPGPLRRAWCLWEILFGSEGALELILSTAQAARFRDALETDFESIQTKVCAVDLRNSDTRNPDDKRMIFEEVEKQIGMSELDARVHALACAAQKSPRGSNGASSTSAVQASAEALWQSPRRHARAPRTRQKQELARLGC